MTTTQNLTTLQETTRSTIDGSEYVRLATTGANWKATLNSIITALATYPSVAVFTKVTSNQYVLGTGGVNAQVGTTYILQTSDNGKIVTLTNANPITLTCPTGLGAAFCCNIWQLGAGQVTVAAGGGATLDSFGGLIHLAGQYAVAQIFAPTANAFILGGQTA